MADTPSIQDRLAANIRGERASRRWTQVQLAERIGVSQRAISEMEAGKRIVSLLEIVALCRALGVPLADLLRGADSSDLNALGIQ